MDIVATAMELLDDGVSSEVFINGAYGMQVLAVDGTLTSHPPPAATSAELQTSLQQFAFEQGVRLDPHFPANGGDFSWPDGAPSAGRYRWHGVISPIADEGPFVSFRKHRFTDAHISFKGPPGWQQTVDTALARHAPVIICGPTGSGKSTFLCGLLRRHCLNQRTILIENVKELPRLAPAWLRLTTTPPLLDGREGFSSQRLLFESLRMRPENIVLGELRGAEAVTFYQAYLTGHGGLFTTVHCDSPAALEKRLDNLCADHLPPESWPRLFAIKSPLVVVLGASPGFRITGLYQFSAKQGWHHAEERRDSLKEESLAEASLKTGAGKAQVADDQVAVAALEDFDLRGGDLIAAGGAVQP